jgi:hypothetical protein
LLNISWGLGQTAYSISGVSGAYQSSDHELKLDELEVKDQRGNVVSWVGYNPMETATLEWVATDTASAAGNAAITYPTQGSKITIGADATDPISGSGWIVQSIVVKKANTDACKLTAKAVRYLAIS